MSKIADVGFLETIFHLSGFHLVLLMLMFALNYLLLKLRLLRIASKHAMEFSVYVLWGAHKKEPP